MTAGNKERRFTLTTGEWLGDAALMAIPLMCLYGTLDYLVHVQFSFEKDFTLQRVGLRILPVGLCLFCLSLGALRFKHALLAQSVFALGAFAAGCALIHLSVEDGTFGCVLCVLCLGVIALLVWP